MNKTAKAKETILNFLLDNSEQSYYLSQISAGTAVPDSTVQHVLEKQIGEDYLVKEKVGNLSYYRLKVDSPLVKQAKIARTLREIDKVVEQLKEVAEKIVLFGSCALGTDRGESDIDLFILSNKKKLAQEIISKTKTRRRIRTIVKTYPEWVTLEETNKYLFGEINKGQVLWQRSYE